MQIGEFVKVCSAEWSRESSRESRTPSETRVCTRATASRARNAACMEMSLLRDCECRSASCDLRLLASAYKTGQQEGALRNAFGRSPLCPRRGNWMLHWCHTLGHGRCTRSNFPTQSQTRHRELRTCRLSRPGNGAALIKRAQCWV